MKEVFTTNGFEFRKLKLADAPIILKQVKKMHQLYSEKSTETLRSIQKDIRKSWAEMRYKKRYQYGIIFRIISLEQ